jgi:hypothetical protein
MKNSTVITRSMKEMKYMKVSLKAPKMELRRRCVLRRK